MLKLIELTPDLEAAYEDYVSEWKDCDEEIIPRGSAKGTIPYKHFLRELNEAKTDHVRKQGWVPATLYFLTDEKNRLYGALQLRHELNPFLSGFGGHIGYGIRPSERRKGYAAKMLALALDKARALHLKRVLLTCDKNNTGSAKTIINNGGVLENEVDHSERTTQRYWIDL
ncbi:MULTISPECIES: GNAT family N-acetyltransferase [unclassified Sporolactobacillus]|uniref:GNAT family N-acetyltransferase n=1 Tax=unclassified Sporolactobacillus TaxID=2628533 RepID=UPI00236775F0|nr:GNAT family N-acetyltransferase [Sporolactobacillus sp. CQH2019]MDD9150583.1 GNAT family N-acetyltransferase [Sporolactobacillus sp. CQH2019]